MLSAPFASAHDSGQQYAHSCAAECAVSAFQSATMTDDRSRGGAQAKSESLLDPPETGTVVLDHDARPVLDAPNTYGHRAERSCRTGRVAQHVGDHASQSDVI